jgi:hypothetical protein
LAEIAGLPLSTLAVPHATGPSSFFQESDEEEIDAPASQKTAPPRTEDAENSSPANDTEVGDWEADSAKKRETQEYSWIQQPSENMVAEDHTGVSWDQVIRGSGGRRVAKPLNSRTDIGSYGLYQGNWSGRRRYLNVRQHIMHDLILRNPAQVLCAQEVDLEFFQALHSPWDYIEEKSPDMTSAVAEARAANWGSWLVIRGTEGDEEDEKGKTQSRSCLVAVRSSRAQNI